MSEASLKLYAEEHSDENALEAILSIFQEAHKAGCAYCFVEDTPARQSYRDQQVAYIIALNLDPQAALTEKIKEYESVSGVDRQYLESHFLNLLSAFTGIKLVCVDVGKRDEEMEMRIKFMSLARNPEKLVMMTIPQIGDALGCPHDRVLEVFDQFITEFSSDASIEAIKRYAEERCADDPLVADFIYSKLDKNSIGIYGAKHVDTNRPISIGSVLRNKIGSKLQVFNISKGQISQISPSALLFDYKPIPQ